MDGVRAYWDGKQLLSRHGNLIEAPSEFLHGLPCDVTLDGELWMGRGTFEELLIALRSERGDWSQVSYYIFDLPASKAPYEQRILALRQMKLPPHVHVVTTQLCQGIQHLNEILDSVLTARGEGLMLVEPHSLYTVGRTSTLLKVKVITNKSPVSNRSSDFWTLRCESCKY